MDFTKNYKKMKKILIALSLFMMVGVAANAQAKKCSKGAKSACCASKAKASASADTAPATRVAAAMTEADIAAEADANVTSRVCEKSGSTSYYMKSVCEKSGAVSWNEAKFCDKSKKFTKVASASMEKDVETGVVKAATTKKACTKAEMKKCAKAGKTCVKGAEKKEG